MTTAGARVTGVRLEYEHGEFVPVSRPRISWRTETEERDWTQRAAEIEFETKEKVQTHRIQGSESVLVEWPFEELRAGSSGVLRVKVAGPEGSVTMWSDPVVVRAGFLEPGEWRAEFLELDTPTTRAQPFLVRGEFEVRAGLETALLFATAHGVYQAEVNGSPVDDQILKPGWTPYAARLIHETTDVTRLLLPGTNVLGATVAGGWFTEVYGFRSGAAPFYGDQPAFAAQLVLRYADGSVEHVATGAGWRTSPGPIVSSGIYAGETTDLRARVPGWSSPDFIATSWAAAATRVVDVVPGPRTSPVVTEIERRPVVDVLMSPSGRLVLDFGQNLVGRLEIRVTGKAGHEITLRHAEVLEAGELSVRPLRRAAATDRLILGDDGETTWQPQFTYHGFRYAEINGWPGDFDPSCVTAIVAHSAMPRTGWFSSSHSLIDRFHESVVWSTRGNFFYLPTDCPQRDERLGWLGDIQVFAPTATFLFESNGLLASWLVDLGLEQQESGGVPFIVPNVLTSARLPAAVWGDAATILPWTLYERFGDVGVLRAQFDSMRSWVDQVLALAGPRRLWEGMFQFGDWLDPTAPTDRPGESKTDPDLIASAYLYRSAQIVADTAEVLGHADVAAEYASIAAEVRMAWRAEYLTPAGRLVSDTQAGYAVAIQFGLIGGSERKTAGDRLAELVRQRGYRISTGFVGTPLIQDALVATGHLDAAARLITQTELPSWLYPIVMGATTIWERWDSLLEDGSVNPGEMTSFNHYALGAVADWLHRVLAGLSPAAPGYRRLTIAPTPLIGFAHAEAVHDTPYGRAESGWRSEAGSIVVSALVPPNTSADVVLPDGARLTVGAGRHEWVVPDPRPAVRIPEDITLDTSLATIIDDPEAYETVWRAIDAVDPKLAVRFRRETSWAARQTLATSTIDTPATVFAALTEALNALNARRRG